QFALPGLLRKDGLSQKDDLSQKDGLPHRFNARQATDTVFAAFAANNLTAHKVDGYAIVTISLKPAGGPPGDVSAAQMDILADLAERFSHGELRVSHEQNLVLPHVALDDVPALYDALAEAGLATPNAGLISDIIACPGLDYCALATARSIPVAQQLSKQFADPDRARNIGPLSIKISGCINACGHHHVGNIGILGLERRGVETYQLTLGGSADENCALGEVTGPGFASSDVGRAIETVIDTYMELRTDRSEEFLDTLRRVGMTPFKQALYNRDVGSGI
ncbi:MAG: nitrite/sulfite reductase, partial [Hyphomicrobiales bacterium]|nr:nitrite/sulfite reductase [Hyphomicrobiales bacterium]